MWTLSLQWVVSFLMLGFGLVGLGVARRIVLPVMQRTSWQMAGTAFALAGADLAVQNTWGSVAFAAGPGSAAWDGYLPWAPMFNHSRTGLLMALFVLLLVSGLRSRGRLVEAPVRRRGWLTVLVLGGLAGAAVGWMEEWDATGHFRNVALSDAAEMVLALTTLFVLLLRESIDRHLWMALSLYAAKLALNALWMSAWIEEAAPPLHASPAYMHGARVVLTAVMVRLALRRLELARHGVSVPGLLSSLPRRGRGARGQAETQRMF